MSAERAIGARWNDSLDRGMNAVRDAELAKSDCDSSVSSWKWVCLAAAVIFCCTLLTEHDFQISTREGFAFQSEDFEAMTAGGNRARQVAYLAYGMLGAVLVYTSRFKPWREPNLLRLLIPAFVLWAMASIAWSTVPGMTARRCFVMLCCFSAVLGLGRRFRFRELALLVVCVGSFVLLMGIGTELVQGTFQPWSGEYRFAGTLHPNAQGMYLSSLALATFSLAIEAVLRTDSQRHMGSLSERHGVRPVIATALPKRHVAIHSSESLELMIPARLEQTVEARQSQCDETEETANVNVSALIHGLLFCIAMLFLVLTKSRTSLAGTLIGLSVIALLRVPLGALIARVLAAVWVGAMFLFAAALLRTGVEERLVDYVLLGRQEEAGSLTGRIPLWTELIPYIEEHPLLGYGYDSFWTPEHIHEVSTTQEWGIHEAHSTYFEAALNLGIVGLLLLLAGGLAGLVQSGWRYGREHDAGLGFFAGLYLFAFVNSITESGMTMPNFVPCMAAAGLVALATQRVVPAEGTSEGIC